MKAAPGYYLRLFDGLYLLEVAAVLLAVRPASVLRRLGRLMDAPDSVVRRRARSAALSSSADGLVPRSNHRDHSRVNDDKDPDRTAPAESLRPSRPPDGGRSIHSANARAASWIALCGRLGSAEGGGQRVSKNSSFGGAARSGAMSLPAARKWSERPWASKASLSE